MMHNSIFFLLISTIIGNVWGKISDLSYGSDPQQKVDLYFPSGAPENTTKVVVVIHGGGWGAGAKSGMDGYIYHFQQALPGHYFANMEYRLGSAKSPGFPKQLQDIAYLMVYLNKAFGTNVTYALLGVSAGAHLSMLYDYEYDSALGDYVKAVVSIVGPTDVTDPYYINNRKFDPLLSNLVGACNYTQCPAMYNVSSPLLHVHKGAAPTIGFYGDQDYLVPISQMTALRDRLQELGVPNKFVEYKGGHMNWKWEDQMDMVSQIGTFLKANWK